LIQLKSPAARTGQYATKGRLARDRHHHDHPGYHGLPFCRFCGRPRLGAALCASDDSRARRPAPEASSVLVMPGVGKPPFNQDSLVSRCAFHIACRCRMRGSLKARGKRDPHQLRHAACTGLCHEIGAIDFDGSWADTEFVGYDLVDLARDQSPQNVPLARR
jgi:hypothetical protein